MNVSRNVITEAVTVGTSAVSLGSLLNSVLPTPELTAGRSSSCWRVSITNTHATNDLFIGYDNTVSATDFIVSITTQFENLGGIDGTIWAVSIDDMWLIASGSGTTVRVAIFDWYE